MKIRLFYIARKDQWFDKREQQISQEEWKSYVKKDRSLEQTFDIGDGNFYVWKGPSKLNPPLIDWRSGMLCSNNPDKALLQKMISIAQDFRANVFDKDGRKYESVEGIPCDFDSELDQQLKKRDSNAQELLAKIPRCLKDFGIVDCGSNDTFHGGHGEELNTGYQIKCKDCDSTSFIINGYYWFNERYKKEYFVAPIFLECCSCGKKNIVYHPSEHGYDPEACSFPHTDFSKEAGARSAMFRCEKCNHNSFELNIWFSYSDDLFEEEEDFDEFSGRKQDLFSWITFEGKCINCNQALSISDYECA